MKLSILVCTVPDRVHQFKRMMGLLLPQSIDRDMEILIDDRPRNVSTGEKRNDLIVRAQGDYFCFVDDDDWISDQYIFLLMSAIEKSPDVVTFCGWMTTNGGARVEWIIKLGEKYEARKDADLITRYYRFPNHLCAFRKDKVLTFKFPHLWKGEDYQWAKSIHDSQILKTEVHINEQLYHYQFVTNKP